MVPQVLSESGVEDESRGDPGMTPMVGVFSANGRGNRHNTQGQVKGGILHDIETR